MDKEATRSEISLVKVTRMTKDLVGEGKDEVKANVEAIKVPGASPQAPKVAMLQQLRLSFIS